MNASKQKALEAAGWAVGDAEDFLGLTDAEREMVELRVALARKVRQLRERHRLTQKQLATRIKSSQSRVAKIEAAEADVSLDLMFRGYFALGGKPVDLDPSRARRAPRRDRPANRTTAMHAQATKAKAKTTKGTDSLVGSGAT